MSEVTIHLLNAIEQGDPRAAEQLFPLVYDALRDLAARQLAREAPGHSLQATALVHEAYVRLVKGDRGRDWDGRRHFFAAAAEAMRRILIDRARQRRSLRRGGGRRRLDLDDLEVPDAAPPEGLLALDEALERLAQEDSTVAAVVKLRYFGGCSVEETAAALHISPRTVNRHWAFARARLSQLLSEAGETGA